ncbi:MAG TPA: glucokinase [Ktedonobacteraceae bacterium]|nr:glucokinase [Ktedonobacteraceae bacterium]
MLLAGDIGGTKTNLAIYSAEAGLRKPLVEATFPSALYPSLEALVRTFLSQTELSVDRACFGVAGPVVAGSAAITNLPWHMSEEQLSESLKLAPVRLINDLEAIARSIPFLETVELHSLSKGQNVTHGNIAIVAPGTGLGEAFLTWNDGSHYHTHTSEGGHCDFAPTNEQEIGLLRYLLKQYDHVSYERVCSGTGIPNIYAYLRDSGFAEEPRWLSERLAEVADFTPVIVNAALDKSSDLCVATLSTFVAILGAEVGNMALKVMATGGIYLGGGIPPRILDFLESGTFMNAYLDKGRFVELLADVSINVILNPRCALLGAASYGLEM